MLMNVNGARTKQWKCPKALATHQGYGLSPQAEALPDPGNSYGYLVVDQVTRVALIVNVGDGMFPAYVDDCEYTEAKALADKLRRGW